MLAHKEEVKEDLLALLLFCKALGAVSYDSRIPPPCHGPGKWKGGRHHVQQLEERRRCLQQLEVRKKVYSFLVVRYFNSPP